MVSDMQLCYNIPEKASACNGDEGGPLVYKDNGEYLCLLGINSFNGKQCINPQLPSVFVSTAVFRNWMRKHIQRLNC